MKVTMDNLNLLHSAITYFVKEPVKDMSRFQESIVFVTHSDRYGFIEQNPMGNYDVWIGEDVIYEIEAGLFDMLDDHSKGMDLMGFYENMRIEDTSAFQQPSLEFYHIVKGSIENILMNKDLPLVGSARVGLEQLVYTNSGKFKINLN